MSDLFDRLRVLFRDVPNSILERKKGRKLTEDNVGILVNRRADDMSIILLIPPGIVSAATKE